MHKEKDLEIIFNKLYFQFWQFSKCLCDRNSGENCEVSIFLVWFINLILRVWAKSKHNILDFAKVHIFDNKLYKIIFSINP